MSMVVAAAFGPAVLLGLVAAVAVCRVPERRLTDPTRLGFLRSLVDRVRRFLDGPHPDVRAVGVLAGWLVVLVALGWGSGALSGWGPDRVALPGDTPVLSWFTNRRVGWLTDVMLAVTWLGDSVVLVTVSVVVGVSWRWLRGSWRALVVGLGAYGGAAILFNVVKRLTARPRPPADVALLSPSGWAYPSGHAVDVAAVLLALLLVAAWSSRRRVTAVASGGAVFAITVVSVSRLYVGVHWLSDVVVGVAMGAAWTAGLAVTLTALWSRRTGSAPD